jgi:hypothetical protein
MPAELWESAALLARTHGVYAVSRDLGLGYDSLKKRVETAWEGEEGIVHQGFVELSGSQLIGSAEVVVELLDVDGRKLTIRLPGGDGIDVRDLSECFWDRRS